MFVLWVLLQITLVIFFFLTSPYRIVYFKQQEADTVEKACLSKGRGYLEFIWGVMGS